MTTEPSQRPTWEELRAQFSLDPEVNFLDAMFIGAQPEPVRAAIRRHMDGMNADPYTYGIGIEAVGGISNTIAGVAGTYLELVDPTVSGPLNVALTNSTTMGLGLIYDGLLLGKGQRVLIPECTPFFTVSALTLRRDSEFDPDSLSPDDPTPADDIAAAGTWQRKDTAVLWHCLDSLDTDRIVARALAAIKPETRVLGLTWVSSATGLKLPIADICHAVRALNDEQGRGPGRRVLTVVDGVHGFGVENASFAELGCDFLITGCHKWLFGPLGTGIVCGRPDAWGWVVPTIPKTRGGEGPGQRNSPGGIRSYADHWALKEAFELHLALGKDRVEERTHGFATALKEGLAAEDGVDVITPMSQKFSAGIVCCRVRGMDAETARERLRREWKISATTSLPDHRTGEVYLRFSPSVRNTMDEVEAAVRATGEIARSP